MSDDRPSEGAGGVLPSPARPPRKPKSPGYTSHNPSCKCGPCRGARRRAKEALAFRVGDGGDGLASEVETSIETALLKPLDADPLPEEVDALMPMVATGRTARDRIAQWIYMRAKEPGISNAEVCRRLGISAGTLSSCLTKARREGWLKMEDPLLRIEHELIPKIVNNLNHFLDEGDRTVTIEAAKGVVFPQYRESKGITETKIAILGLQIQLPESGDMTQVGRGMISGMPKPAALEAEIISGRTKLPGE